ncbi:MAG: DegT/DnrJ/EryC1/StrS family aminotransferase, partial [Pseudonocardiaceae bacterium]
SELAHACRDWGVPLVEDAAQAHGTSLSGRYAGTHGMIGTFSTHARKLICTGEGGFCLTGDPVLADRLRQLRNLGQPPGGSEFGAGFGLNCKLSAVAAALGRVQLSRLTSRLAQRRLILAKLTSMAGEIAGLEPFPIPHDAEPNGFAALFTAEPDLASRIAHRSRAAGIESDVLRYNYQPLYRTPVLARYAPTQPCRNAERLSTTLLTVPCHERVATEDLVRIGAAWRGGGVKHATASVFLLARAEDTWHIGLIRHPRLGKWMLPGGHVEPDENPAEAARREVAEETGLTARLLPGPQLNEPEGADEPSVITPLWIVEQHVPAERREPEPHIHVDHLYLALADATAPAPGAELPFAWYTTHQLHALDMFGDTRARATYLLNRIDTLTAATTYDRVPG